MTRQDSSERVSNWPNTYDNAEYVEAVTRVILRCELTEGREAEALEDEFVTWFDGRSYAHAVSSGTDAIEVALRALQLPPGTEVIVPSLTFSGTVLPVIRAGLVPVFADVDPGTFNLTVETVRAVDGPRVEVILPVHLHGLPAPVDELVKAFPNRFVVEDCAQAYGARIRGQHVGTFGDAACWSLNRTKSLFAGEGGLLTTRKDFVWANARSLRRYGERFDGLDHDDVSHRMGSNFKLPELSAAVARVSLSELDARIGMAQESMRLLNAGCAESSVLRAPWVPSGYVHAGHKYRVEAFPDVDPGEAFRALQKLGVPVCRWQSRALPHHPVFMRYARDGCCEVADDVLQRTFIVGTEARPLASVSPLIAEEWADKISYLKESM